MSTLASLINENASLYANCSDPRCFASTKLDLHALAARLGSGHGGMHDDLTPLLKCQRCRAEGRPHRRAFLTCIPNYAAHDAKRMAGVLPKPRS